MWFFFIRQAISTKLCVFVCVFHANRQAGEIACLTKTSHKDNFNPLNIYTKTFKIKFIKFYNKGLKIFKEKWMWIKHTKS